MLESPEQPEGMDSAGASTWVFLVPFLGLWGQYSQKPQKFLLGSTILNCFPTDLAGSHKAGLSPSHWACVMGLCFLHHRNKDICQSSPDGPVISLDTGVVQG